jgi:hypothetical protein
MWQLLTSLIVVSIAGKAKKILAAALFPALTG